MKLPFAYGLPCHEDNANIMRAVRFKPTKEELQDHFEKIKDDVFSDFLAEHKKLEQEYEDTIKALETDTNEWRIAFWGSKKEYYEMYLGGINTDEYKEVLKKIEELKKGGKK